MNTNTLIIFDFMRTLYDPECATLLPGVQAVLEWCQEQHYDVVLVSKPEGQRPELVATLGIADYFRALYFEADKQICFKQLRSQYPDHTIWVVGDRVRGEIRYGNEIGAVTVWLKRGRFKDELPVMASEHPDFTITEISAVLDHLAP